MRRNCAKFRVRPSEWRKRWSKLRPDMRSIQRSLEKKEERNGRHADGPQLVRMLEFLEWSREFVEALETELTDLSHVADHDQRAVGTIGGQSPG